MKKIHGWATTGIITLVGVLGSEPVQASFSSGSTGADGAFAPTANLTVQLPESGVLNYTTVNIPAGVTVKFAKNSRNTPVTILTTGDVIINGTIDFSGTNGATVTDNVSADDTLPGLGGPGGSNGGFGGSKTSPGAPGGAGLGPGGGPPGTGLQSGTSLGMSGNGGGYATAGGVVGGNPGTGGAAYGAPGLLPLIGGSGGGGGASTSTYSGSGGGGGAGAILIASSGTVQLNGSIKANGGTGGTAYVASCSHAGAGGSGSGGAIRITANAVTGSGTLSASGGAGVTVTYFTSAGACASSTSGKGGDGRIRVEAPTISLTGTTTPALVSSFATAPVTVPDLPTLRITVVGGTAAPAQPSGLSDITLPFNTANPVTVELAATGVPAGTVVKVTITPTTGSPTTVNSSPLSGTTSSSTATASITLPGGHSVISAAATFTVQIAALDLSGLPALAEGERIEQIRVAAVYGADANGSGLTYITSSGRELGPLSAR